MKYITKLNDETVSFLKSNATILNEEYYFLPFWFEATDDPNVFELHHLDGKLPQELEDVIGKNRQ